MFSPLRNRFGIPGAISVIALVFAMLGGAYAANNDNGGGKATASAKGKPGPRGPRGKTGPAGPAGPQGPAGANGAKGDTGAAGSNGKDGTNGSNGTNGTGATTASFGGAQHGCTDGGIEVKSASPAVFVCNGKKGDNGADGQTGYVETLPSGKTLTGVWSASANDEFEANIVPISFAFPLAAAPTAYYVVAGEAQAIEVTPAGGFGQIFPASAVDAFCPGTAASPTAVSGALCVYIGSAKEMGYRLDEDGELLEIMKPTRFGTRVATTTGAGQGKEGSRILGTWAVKAP